MSEDTQGVYVLRYGYSDHQLLLVESRETIERLRARGVVPMETSKHCNEDVDLSEIELISEDPEFVKQIKKYSVVMHYGDIEWVMEELEEE